MIRVLVVAAGSTRGVTVNEANGDEGGRLPAACGDERVESRVCLT